MLIDCHVHLDSYTNDEVFEILQRGRDVGVGFVISAGTTLASTQRSLELSKTFPDFFSGVGIHPMDIEEPFDDSTYERLRDMALSTDKVLVVSEIGLDFMEGMPDRALQYEAFRQQIRLARDLGRPVIFHSRESHDEAFRVLREEKAYEVGGVMHYFQGTLDDARKVLDMGLYISLARPLLRLPHLQAVAAELPLDSIVLETDSAPQPFKPKRENWTEPRYTRFIAEKLAELQGKDVEEVVQATTANMRNLLGDGWATVETYVQGARIGD
ncbi:MAG: hypothetical protein BZY79_02355 [SAR202 cluster bacterium Casp-Chloro-G4]|nr:TatD family hydrolase [Chloroflexota bacterium]MDA1228022.1 TatD family hydrolase [Chloroflexota bacterium]PKB61673.1 MAG: hypothetical protein BZY79_02355 [SAR202 cluster bacterium Casp-Chloro-G4]